jgi:hypothetical protein
MRDPSSIILLALHVNSVNSKLTYYPPGIGTRQKILAKYGLPPQS